MVAAQFQITRECRICSPRCSKTAYKRRKDEEKRREKLAEMARQIPTDKEYIKVSEAYALFEISRNVLYRQIRKGLIPFINMGQKQIRVSRTELMKHFSLRKEPLKAEKPQPKLYSMEPADCYTIGEVLNIYHVDDSTLWAHIRKYSIPTRQIGNYVYVSKKEIDKLYQKEEKDEESNDQHPRQRETAQGRLPQ